MEIQDKKLEVITGSTLEGKRTRLDDIRASHSVQISLQESVELVPAEVRGHAGVWATGIPFPK